MEQFLDRKKFTLLVETHVRDTSSGYMDAILHLCEKNSIEPEDVKRLISNPLKSKVEAEAIQLNYLKGGNTLPI